MANWCSNTVVFEGDEEAIKKVQQLFQAMKEKEEKAGHGQLPEFTKEKDGGYFFDIYWNEGDIGIFQYETKWSPNIEIVQKVAEFYNVGFELDYEETSNLIYGRASFSDKLLTDIFLEGEDWDTYQFDGETDTYLFEGEEYECDSEILETLLERKIANHYKKTAVHHVQNTHNATATTTSECELEKLCRGRFQHLTNAHLVKRVNGLPDFGWDDEGVELQRRMRESNGTFDYGFRGNTMFILKDEKR